MCQDALGHFLQAATANKWGEQYESLHDTWQHCGSEKVTFQSPNSPVVLFAFLAAMSSPDFTKFHKAVLKKALDNVGITATGSKDALVDRCLKQPLEYRVG